MVMAVAGIALGILVVLLITAVTGYSSRRNSPTWPSTGRG
jgi:hypothetical protein